MTMTVVIDGYCYHCGRTHRVRVQAWSEHGEPVEVEQLEPCDPPEEAA